MLLCAEARFASACGWRFSHNHILGDPGAATSRDDGSPRMTQSQILTNSSSILSAELFHRNQKSGRVRWGVITMRAVDSCCCCHIIIWPTDSEKTVPKFVIVYNLAVAICFGIYS